MERKAFQVKAELQRLKCESKLYELILCSEEENQIYRALRRAGGALPPYIFELRPQRGQPDERFARLADWDMTLEEKDEWMRLKQYRELHIIRNCLLFGVIFFVMAACAAMLLWLIR